MTRKRVSPGASLEERIMLHSDRSGSCWIWTASIDANGYGRVYIDKKLLYAHRVAYTAFVAPIPDGLEIDHLCRTRACCNPEHLEAVTPQVNVRRGESPGARARRRDMCIHGVHRYAEFGFIDREGRRACRGCNRDYCNLWRAIPYAERMRRKFAGELVVDLAAYYAEIREAAA